MFDDFRPSKTEYYRYYGPIFFGWNFNRCRPHLLQNTDSLFLAKTATDPIFQLLICQGECCSKDLFSVNPAQITVGMIATMFVVITMYF
jgi:hypothetical protein